MTLASTVTNATETEALRDRQEVVRIRLEHMLTEADSRSTRVLLLALQKCNIKLDTLAAATRHIDESRTRMRVIESKYFHGSKASELVAPELRTLHIERGGLATLVEQIQCTLFDQVRIHYLLTQLTHKLSTLSSLLHMLDRKDTSSSSLSKRSDRLDDLAIITSVPKQQTSYHQQPHPSSHRNQRHGRGRDSSSHTSPHPRSSFSGDTVRRSAFNRRVSRSYAFRQHSQDHAAGIAASSDRGSTGTSGLNTPRSLSRGSDTATLIPLAMKRALSYNSVAPNSASPEEGEDEEDDRRHANGTGSAWDKAPHMHMHGTVPMSNDASSVTSSPGRRTGGARGNGRLSFGNVQARFRGDRERATGGSGSAKSIPNGRVEGRMWKRRTGRVADDLENTEEEGLHVSPVSFSIGDKVVKGGGNGCGLSLGGAANWSGRVDSDASVILDIDSLCTEASSILSSSRGMDGEKARRRGSLSAGLRQEALLGGGGGDETVMGKGLTKFGFGRLRVQGQMKKLWGEINELYSIVLTHGPHLVEEEIVSEGSVESGLLGSWNAGKGQGMTLRVNFQNGVVTEAMRAADGVVNWQHRLVVAIRRDFYEQRKALSEADLVISQAYLSALDVEEEKFSKNLP